MGDGRRPKRVAESIRNYLARELAAQLHDPRLVGAIVTRVEVTPDLSLARIYVRRIATDAQPERTLAAPGSDADLLAGLRRASGRLRRGLGPSLRLKRLPELRFEYDTGSDAADRIARILKELESERQAQPPPDDPIQGGDEG